MDNQAAMFTAQQMQYNKMYGMDPSRRMDELAAAQSQLGGPRYGQHPWVESSIIHVSFPSLFFFFVLVIVVGVGKKTYFLFLVCLLSRATVEAIMQMPSNNESFYVIYNIAPLPIHSAPQMKLEHFDSIVPWYGGRGGSR